MLGLDLATPHTMEVITDAACSNMWVLHTPGHVSRIGRESTTPGDCDVAVRSPRGNSPVFIRGIGVSPTRECSASLDVLNKQKSISPSVSRNTQKFDASVDGNLADDGDSTSIFSKVLGRELPDSLSADIYLRCPMDFTSSAVGTKAPDFVHLDLPAVNTSDEFNTFGAPATRARRPTDGPH